MMLNGPRGAQLHNRLSSSPAVASLSPVCARHATHAVGLATTAFTGRTPPRLLGPIETAACCSTVALRSKMPRGRPDPEQHP